MCYYILTESGAHLFRTSVQTFSDEDMWNPDVKKRLKEFDVKISVNLAYNDILTDAEYPTEGWHLDYTAELDSPYLPYEPET